MITLERLRELLDYDPETGGFSWRVGRGYRGRSVVREGDPAGCLHKTKGYEVITLDYVCYRAHRLAWFYMYGSFPEGGLDHKNGVRSDNRICNLREATPAQNIQNSKSRSRSNQMKGTERLPSGRWRSRIRINGKHVHLGMFNTEQEANEAYFNSACELYGEFARK